MFSLLTRAGSCGIRIRATPAWIRHNSTGPSSSSAQTATAENANVAHSRFLAEASPGQDWKKTDKTGTTEATRNDFDSVSPGKGKLSPTSSHLFKLILPLSLLAKKTGNPRPTEERKKPDPPPTVILLHPSQPLSHVSRLILASLAPDTPNISFQNEASTGQAYQWSDSTDVGDFIRDAARAAQFTIHVSYSRDQEDTIVEVEVPTFADRTRFLRRRLDHITSHLKEMEGLKAQCDKEAHRGAKRLALGGFGMLVAYWGTVCRLTFWDLGWEVMEPVTYLSGLSTVICGYLWFLYQGREVSYSSVLDRSISTRREALYKSRGLDIDLWMDHVSEAKNLRREIERIADDYDQDKLRSQGETKKKQEGGKAGEKKKKKGTEDEEDDTQKQAKREADMESRKKELDKSKSDDT